MCLPGVTIAIWALMLQSTRALSLPASQPPDASVSSPSLSINSSVPDSTLSTEDLSTFNLTASNSTDTDLPPIKCFGAGEEHYYPTTVQACDFSLDAVLKRDLPDFGPLDYQTFAHKPAPEGFHSVPDMWIALDSGGIFSAKECRIFISTTEKTDRDRFRLVDIASDANRIVRECLEPREGKVGLGGLVLMARENGFFIVVDGFGPQPPAMMEATQ